MADNVVANPGVGGATFATDDDGTAQHPYTKVEWGPNNTQTPVDVGAAALPIQDGGNSITVDGTVAVTNAGLTELAAAINASSQMDVNIAASGATVPVSNAGLTELAAAINASSQMDVNIAASGATVPVSNAGLTELAAAINASSQMDVNIAASGATVPVSIATNTPVGNVAHDAADSGNPVKIGVKAESSTTGVTLVADADRTDLYADLDGLLITKNATAWGDLLSERVSNTDGASTAFSTFGATAGQKNMITAITVHNAHATTNGFVDIRDGTAGAVLWTIPLPATGGAVLTFDPPLKQPTANTALAFDVSAAITTIYISINGFKSKIT